MLDIVYGLKTNAGKSESLQIFLWENGKGRNLGKAPFPSIFALLSLVKVGSSEVLSLNFGLTPDEIIKSTNLSDKQGATMSMEHFSITLTQFQLYFNFLSLMQNAHFIVSVSWQRLPSSVFNVVTFFSLFTKIIES